MTFQNTIIFKSLNFLLKNLKHLTIERLVLILFVYNFDEVKH